MSCDCSGREFGGHRLDCPEKNGRYTMRFERTGTCWPCVALVLIGVLIFWAVLR